MVYGMKYVISLVLFLLFTLSHCRILKSNPEVEDKVLALLKNCEFEVKSSILVRNSCRNNEDKQFANFVRQKGVHYIIPTLAVLFNSKDKRIVSMASHLLYKYVKDKLEPIQRNPKLLPSQAVEGLIAGLEKNKDSYTFYATAAITRLATIYHFEEKMISVLNGHSEFSVTMEGYQNLMVYGKISTLPPLKKLLEGSNIELQRAALIAPRKAKNLTTEENEQVCRWLATHLQKENLVVAAEAAKSIATICRGIYLTQLLDRAEQLARENRLKPPFSFALTSFGFTCKSFLGTPPSGNQQQCLRKKKLIDQIQK